MIPETASSILTGITSLLPALGALLLLVLTIVKLDSRYKPAALSSLFLLAALFMQYQAGVPGPSLVMGGFLYADNLSSFMNVLILLVTLATVLMALKHPGERGGSNETEYHALLLLSASGAMVLSSAAELITMFLGLELMSLSLYCLCAISGRRAGSEGALKYFILGSYSSAFLLFGMALLYGVSGSTFLVDIARIVPGNDALLLKAALALIVFGLAFKAALVPFHFWAPDAYQGAPIPVTAFMACAIKAAAFAVSLRVLFWVFPAYYPLWSQALWWLSLLSMVFGNLIALRQRSVIRMLAFSSIAHAGYILTAFLAPLGSYNGVPAVLYYLAAYSLSTVGAFSVLYLLISRVGFVEGADDINSFRGFGYSHPLMAIAMSLFLLSLAGLPPGLAGLLGKFYVFNAAIKTGYTTLVIAGVLASAVSCCYYLRVIVMMYFAGDLAPVGEYRADSLPLRFVVSVCALLILIIGVWPGMLN